MSKAAINISRNYYCRTKYICYLVGQEGQKASAYNKR